MYVELDDLVVVEADTDNSEESFLAAEDDLEETDMKGGNCCWLLLDPHERNCHDYYDYHNEADQCWTWV